MEFGYLKVYELRSGVLNSFQAEDMGEIDTKPIESVQSALSLFGEKSDHRKHWPNGSNEMENESDLDELQKDLANCKVQLEAKESLYMQTLLKLEYYQKMAEELSVLLKISESERERYIDDCIEAQTKIDELESKMEEINAELSETVKTREQLSHVTIELKVTQGELLTMETELADARESKLKAVEQAELIENAIDTEREKVSELLKNVSELCETIAQLKLTASELEQEKSVLLSEKETEIDLARTAAVLAQEQLEEMQKRVEMVEDLGKQLVDKSMFVDMLQLELQQANELLCRSEKADSNANNELSKVKLKMELEEWRNLDQGMYVQSLEVELNHLKLELESANEEIGSLKSDVERLTDDLKKAKPEMDEIRGRENEAQVEIAHLKSKLHKGRSRIAAAEAAEERAKSIKSGLYLAVQTLAIEAEEAKKENRLLKVGTNKVAEDPADPIFFSPGSDYNNLDLKHYKVDNATAEAEEAKEDSNHCITISVDEYETLTSKAKKADQLAASSTEDSTNLTLVDGKQEMDVLRKELETAMLRIAEFRTRAEQAVTRAEVAERAKAALEHRLTRSREQKEKRKAAIVALQEEFTPKVETPKPKVYQPLGKATISRMSAHMED
ncbi:WEB family [Dillenia turbinata]|uniref:WEB family n=1 Tax=Dillenia turbinata TaxID=194707 RepID=A0AAN8YZI7_9MAGN